jgi:hypothetical protein
VLRGGTVVAFGYLDLGDLKVVLGLSRSMRAKQETMRRVGLLGVAVHAFSCITSREVVTALTTLRQGTTGT